MNWYTSKYAVNIRGAKMRMIMLRKREWPLLPYRAYGKAVVCLFTANSRLYPLKGIIYLSLLKPDIYILKTCLVLSWGIKVAMSSVMSTVTGAWLAVFVASYFWTFTLFFCKMSRPWCPVYIEFHMNASWAKMCQYLSDTGDFYPIKSSPKMFNHPPWGLKQMLNSFQKKELFNGGG